MVDGAINANLAVTGHLNLVLLFGIIVLAGTIAERLFQKLRIPQIVGCIFIGILVGNSVFNLVTLKTIDALKPFTMFVLGIIGFMIGGELRREVFKKYGRQFFIILFSQGLGAFVLVGVGTGLVMWFVTESLNVSIAAGLVLGAIASATAPAATANVLWEYKTRGVLTAAVLAIVALDDALSLLLFRGAAAAAQGILGKADGSVFITVGILSGEILGAILLGFLAGVLLYVLSKFVRADDKVLSFAIAALLLVVGVSMVPDIDPILPAMTLGITFANLEPRRSKHTFELVGKFSPPIYVLFFVLAGAYIEFSKIVSWMVVMIAVYTLTRLAGKVLGSWFGARQSSAPAVVRKYLGICLLPQAGVAIGLAVLSSQMFRDSVIGHTVIITVMTATFLMEILGPPLVKLGVQKAGEIGMNVTEEDLIKTYKVKDVMDAQPTTIPQDLMLKGILDTFSTSDSLFYPVLDEGGRLVGIITIADIKQTFATQEVAGWLLACDVMEPVLDKTTPDTPLEEALDWMSHHHLEEMPVVARADDDKLVGVLDFRAVNRKISAEVLHRHRQADGVTPATTS